MLKPKIVVIDLACQSIGSTFDHDNTICDDVSFRFVRQSVEWNLTQYPILLFSGDSLHRVDQSRSSASDGDLLIKAPLLSKQIRGSQMLMRSRGDGLILVFVMSLVALGCGASGKPQDNSGPNAKTPDGAVQIKGTVTIDGNPAEGVKIILIDPEQLKKVVAARGFASGPSGTTDEKGAFEISTVKKGDGVVPGAYKIVFEWFPGGTSSFFDDPAAPVPPAIAAKLPPGVMAFHNKYKAGGSGNADLKVEAGKSETDVKFALTTKGK